MSAHCLETENLNLNKNEIHFCCDLRGRSIDAALWKEEGHQEEETPLVYSKTKKEYRPNYDFASSVFIRKLKKLEDASGQLGLTNTRNSLLSSGLVPEVLDNQVMQGPSVKPMERTLIAWELNIKFLS
eukprot:jgi/Psemu1/53387/gm1.53387_g